ncbi:winged helix-turn-helix domain-containing protein [Haloechinothrix sp. YIM 98757]|uniref:Winged helix-turn-helix domain-containing protein n=1 Tax=Haloechinothrix aidingensis TaxID=2752311 RepID=A0A838AF46_9PSEU|nr:winged helix-turn-helix domain-containing protein [Haloechinothrix aidingensis]
MWVQLLGPVTLLVDQRPVAVGGPGARGVLALLALNANQVLAQGEIIDALWGHDPPATARTIVHGHVSSLRRTLARAQEAVPEAVPRVELRTVSPGYQLMIDEQRVDAHRARALLERSERMAPARRAGVLADAIALWRGPVLADVGEFITAPDLEELRLAIHGARIDAELELGRHSESIAEIGALVRENPHSERFTGQLVRALYHSGRRADALDAYHNFSRRLVRELGIEPGPGLRELHGRVLADDLDAGDKDDEDRARHVAPMQLPPAIPALAGRAAAFEWLDDLLARAGSNSHVVGIVSGTAGVGKSALVLSWAHRVAERFPDGVLYAGLCGFDPNHPPRDPVEVLAQLLNGLGVRSSELPETVDERAGLYRSLLAGRRVLVVLDDARTAAQVRPLLAPAAGAVTVVTSRARLDDLAVSAAARLLTLSTLRHCDAARVITELTDDRPELAELSGTLAELCGYLPLALRIVGARLAGRPPGAAHELIGALHDERTRLGALELDSTGADEAPIGVRAALDVSVAELSATEAETLCALGVFPGGAVRPHLVAALCVIDVSEARRRLRGLAAQNLLTESAPDTFVAHDLVRAYAAELARHGEDDSGCVLLTRALDYYLAVADTARRSLGTVVDGLDCRHRVPAEAVPDVDGFDRALDWFAAEWPNVLAMVRRGLAAGRVAEVWQLARLAHPYRVNRPHWDDWIALVDTGLSAAREAADQHALFWMLISRCAARLIFERLDGLLDDAERALEIAERLGERSLEVTARIHRGCALTSLGRHSEAFAAQLAALAEAESIGDETLRVQAMHNYAEAQKRAGGYSEAIEFQSRAFEMYARLGLHGDVIRGLANLAEMKLYAGDLVEAERTARDTIELAAERDFTLQEGVGRLILGRVLRSRGDLDGACTELAAALELHELVGDAHVDDLRAELKRVRAEFGAPSREPRGP